MFSIGYWGMFYLLVILFVDICSAKIHHLSLENDRRRYILLSNFGYLQQGYLEVDLSNLTFSQIYGEQPLPLPDKGYPDEFGFTLSRGEDLLQYVKNNPTVCPFSSMFKRTKASQMNIVFFTIHFVNNTKVTVDRKGINVEKLAVCKDAKNCATPGNIKTATTITTNQPKAKITEKPRQRRDLVEEIFNGIEDPKNATTKPPIAPGNPKPVVKPQPKIGNVTKRPEALLKTLPLRVTPNENSFSFYFKVVFWDAIEEGQYVLMYHNCYNHGAEGFSKQLVSSFTITITEENELSYLTAGDIPKPMLYFALAALFFATGIVWLHMMKSHKQNEIYRIHYLMLLLVVLKCLSLFSHGVNYYFISLYGHQREVWAVVYYIMHLLKGALLFGTIILIGTGYTFFKNFLTERDRKLFIVVIPLQVLNNIALIIMEEKEQGEKNYRFWTQLFIFIDLVCCVAIILPVIWSIRHLQEASRTDGKAAFNLEKLQIFRHFYIIIICYIYLTRILKYLIVFTVPFRFAWLDVLVTEVGTWLFFVVTGYKFKPEPNNPYLKLSQSDDELEMDDVLTPSGLLEGVSRVKRITVAVSDEESSPEPSPKIKATVGLDADGAGPDIF